MAGDAALVARYLGGDQAALGDIYERYADPVHDLCRAMLFSEDDAADAFQDTFLTAAHKLGQLRDPERLRPWLYSVARNQCRARIRARGRTKLEAEAGAGVGVEVDMSGPIERAELAALIADARAGLNQRDQEILDLHMRHGLEGDDLAAVLGVSTQNAYKLVQRVRGRVERSLGALLVARHSRGDCDELTSLLADWDGRFTPTDRKRVSRHIDDCDTCSTSRRALLDPSGFAAAMPMAGPPAALRARVTAMLAASPVAGPGHELRHWRRDGFPRVRSHRLRRALTIGAVSGLLLVAATAGVLLATVLRTADSVLEVVETGPDARGKSSSTTLDPTTSAGPVVTTTPTTSTTSVPLVPVTTTTLATTTAPPTPTTTSTAPTTSSTSTTTTTTTTTPPPADTTTTTPPPADTTTTTTTTRPPPADTIPPRITSTSSSPLLIWERNTGTPCDPATRSSIRVVAVDNVAVTAVRLVWTTLPGPTGTLDLVENAGEWRGNLVISPGTFLTFTDLTIAVTATDAAGNATTATVPSVTVGPCP